MMSEKKKRVEREAGMSYCPYMVLSHDTTDCIVTQAHRGA